MSHATAELAFAVGTASIGLMHKLLLALLFAAALPVFAQEDDSGGDTGPILELPAKLAAARKKAQVGWDSGITTDMVEATEGYNAALRGMIMELGKNYYTTPPTKSQVAELERSFAVQEVFGQLADNPRGEALGSIVRVELASAISDGLGKTVVRMVQALLEDDPKHPFDKWKDEWDKVWGQDE